MLSAWTSKFELFLPLNLTMVLKGNWVAETFLVPLNCGSTNCFYSKCYSMPVMLVSSDTGAQEEKLYKRSWAQCESAETWAFNPTMNFLIIWTMFNKLIFSGYVGSFMSFKRMGMNRVACLTKRSYKPLDLASNANFFFFFFARIFSIHNWFDSFGCTGVYWVAILFCIAAILVYISLESLSLTTVKLTDGKFIVKNYSINQRIVVPKTFYPNKLSITVTMRKSSEIFEKSNVPTKSYTYRVESDYEERGYIVGRPKHISRIGWKHYCCCRKWSRQSINFNSLICSGAWP